MMSESVCAPVVELSINAESADARRASAWLERNGIASGVPADQITRLDHCVDEVLANIVAHGGPGARRCAVHLELVVRHGEARVTITDAGIAFNPVAAPPGARPASLAEAQPGGLGLSMLRSYSDHLAYRREAGRNQLTLTVRWRETG
jgi:anti-sigma regulatory factor (Ser/Thr protein kinase)